FLTGPDGTTGTAYLPPGLTAQAAGLRQIGMAEYEGQGVAFHYVPAYGGVAVRPSALFDLARASGDSRAAGYTAKSIGKALRRAGALVPGSARPVKRVTIAGVQHWMLVIPETVIWPDLADDAGDAGPDGAVPHGQDDGGPGEPAGDPAPAGPTPSADAHEAAPAAPGSAVSNKHAPASPGVPAAPPADSAERVRAGEPTRSAIDAPPVRPVLAAGVTEYGVTWVGPDGTARVEDGGYDDLPSLLAA